MTGLVLAGLAPVASAQPPNPTTEFPLDREILPEWHWRENTEAFVRGAMIPAASALSRQFRESGEAKPPVLADPASPAPPRAAPYPVRRLGPLSVGDELADGWFIAALDLEADRVTIRVRGRGVRVTFFASTDPSARAGPFDRNGVALAYQNTPVPQEAFAAAARDLVQRWVEAAPGGQIGEALPSWAAAARRAAAADALDQALERLQRGDMEGVVAALGPLNYDPDAPVVSHLIRGLAARGTGAFIGELGRAALGLSDPVALYGIVRILTAAGQFEQGQGVMARLGSVAPSSAALPLAEGDRHLLRGDWTAAEASYRRAVAADPLFFGARGSLGDVLYRRRAYDEAAVELRAALALDPSQGALLHRLGAVELDRDRAADAVPLLERATAAVPAQVEPWRDLGRALLRLGRSEEAAKALARAIALKPEDPAPRYVLAQALERLGRREEAAAALADAIARSEADRERRGKAIQASPRP